MGPMKANKMLNELHLLSTHFVGYIMMGSFKGTEKQYLVGQDSAL